MFKIDWDDVSYISNSLLAGKLSPDAVSQRVARTVKKENLEQFLTLKMAQALATYKRKVK